MVQKSIFVKLLIAVLLVVYVSTLAKFQLVPSASDDNLLVNLLTLGGEDVNYKDYGEFGYNFAPAEALLKRAGFRTKLHYFVTDDGYVIELIHVINPLANRTMLREIPVMLSHGYIQASYNFVCQSINESMALKWPRKTSDTRKKSSPRNLAILLANNGFDVWLPTSRGSLANSKPTLKLHTKYSTNDPRFWRFSLDEQAKYDIPCMVDAVRNLTGKSQVVFAGYSQSTFTMIGKLAIDPSFAKKIHTFLCIAPVTSLKHDSGLLRPVGAVLKNIPDIFTDFPFIPPTLGRIITKIALAIYFVKPDLVLLFIRVGFNLVFGYNGLKEYDGLLFLGRLLRFPTSFRGLLQFIQNQFEDRMSFFDHGVAGNLQLFGSPRPAIYNTSAIELDGIAIFVGEKDSLSKPEDNAVWIDSLQFPPILYKMIPGWNHLDYIIAEDNDVQMNLPILRLLSERMK